MGEERNNKSGFKGYLTNTDNVNNFESQEKALTAPKQTFTTSRELARQQTRKKPSEGNLFSLLNPKQRKDAEKNQENLLSLITDGINGGALVSKVIIGLAQTLYVQSEMYHTTDKMIGLSYDVSEQTGEKIEVFEVGTRKDPDTPVISPSPFLMIKTRDFAKLVNGGKLSGGKDVEAVRDILTQLDKYFVPIDTGTGKHTFVRIITIEAAEVDPQTGAERLILKLRPIFTRALTSDFMTIRKDTLKILSGKQKDITMRLFWYLAEKSSYKNLPTYPTFKVAKAELFERIAIIKAYDSKPKRREEDFKEAIYKMKSLHLITDYSEEIGAAGDVICIFKFNKNYTTEAPSPPTALLPPPERPDSPTATPPQAAQSGLFDNDPDWI